MFLYTFTHTYIHTVYLIPCAGGFKLGDLIEHRLYGADNVLLDQYNMLSAAELDDMMRTCDVHSSPGLEAVVMARINVVSEQLQLALLGSRWSA